MIPDEMEELLDSFTLDSRMSGFNQTYTAEDGNALFHFRHWLRSDDELRVRVYVDETVPDDKHSSYIDEFTAFLANYDFAIIGQFEEVEDEYAEFREQVAYETTVSNPYAE